MGFDRVTVEFLLHEHRHKPITGKLLTIGRQTVGLTPQQAIELIKESGTSLRDDAVMEIDKLTVHTPAEGGFISDVALFSLFSTAKVAALDVTDYEGAEYIHDMGVPIPPSLKEQFDFIINGSCLDNIFDPATAIKNVSKMLKPGGRTLDFEWSNSHATAYLKYSPDWFLDYYAINNFDDCKVYLINYPNSIDMDLDGRHRPEFFSRRGHHCEAWHFDPLVINHGQIGFECSSVDVFNRNLVLVIAEKGNNSTSDVSPVQKHYRGSPAAHAPYIAAAQRFTSSSRPVFSNGRVVPRVAPISPNPVLRCVAVW